MTKAELGQELRRLRLAAGLSQVELASKIGYAQTSVSTVEVGAAWAPLDIAMNWAEACGSAARLSFGRDERPPDADRLLAAWARVPAATRQAFLAGIEAAALAASTQE